MQKVNKLTIMYCLFICQKYLEMHNVNSILKYETGAML